jgi:hypothetical protein
VWEEVDELGIGTVNGIEWDVEHSHETLQGLFSRLEGNSNTIYRASVELGTPPTDVLQPLTRTGSPENEIDLRPDNMQFTIGPIETYGLGYDESALVGWLSLDFSGYGYLFPWQPSDIVKRASAAESIGRLTAVCNNTWPVPKEPVGQEVQAAREAMGNLWPYPTDLDWDWYWGIREG